MAFPQDVPEWVSGARQGDGSVNKYNRALEQLKKQGQPVTEEAVKALYIKFGGAVIEVPVEEVEEVAEVKETVKEEKKAKK